MMLDEHKSVRISRKLLADLPDPVAAAIRNVQARYQNIKSLTYQQVSPDHKFYGGEGYAFTVVHGERSHTVEMVAEHNVGAAGLNWNIGGSFTAPPGTFVLEVSYYTKYWLRLYNVGPARLH